MARTGLPYEFILDTALQLVEEKGFDKFSMHDLAKALGIKTPSLYNHFSGIKQLQKELALKIEQDLYHQSTQAMKDRSPDDMIRALAHTQFAYAKQHPHLYQVILALPTIEKNDITDDVTLKSDTENDSSAKALATAPSLENAAWHSVEPIRIALSQYKLSDADAIHLNRMFRSTIHGYISLASAGYLAHQKYSTQESFDATVEYFIALVHLQEKEAHISHDFYEK